MNGGLLAHFSKLKNFQILPHSRKPPLFPATLWLLFVCFKVWICAYYVITLIDSFPLTQILIQVFAYFLGRDYLFALWIIW